MSRRQLRVLLMLIFLVPIDSSVNAEWLALEDRYQSHPLQTVYIDLGNIHQERDMVMISVLIDWKAMQGGRTPTRFYSTTLIKQVDCGERQVRTLTSTDFYGHMGTGEVIGGGSHTGEAHWVAIEVEGLNRGLWEAACKKT